MVQIPDLSDIPELEATPEGEYNLKIVSCQETISRNTGREGLLFVIHNLDDQNSLPIFHRVWFPMEGDEESKAGTMWRMIKEFLTSLGMSAKGGQDPDDFVGIEFRGLVGLEKDQNERDANVLKRVTEA